MATAEQVKALLKSHAEGDDDRFYSVVLQMAAKAARNGHSQYARDLKELADSLRKPQQSENVRPIVRSPSAKLSNELSDVLSVSAPDYRLSNMALQDETRVQLDRTILEHRQRDKLADFGFAPLRRLLLMGPPGTGKTLTAAALAAELNLPLLTIRLESLITRYLGETSARLRKVFDAIEVTRGLYLFDEVDALGAERARDNDVGEMRRVLNSFLQFLDSVRSDSLIVATTNHPQLLDQAIFRRFDAMINYRLPGSCETRKLVEDRLAPFLLADVVWSDVQAAASGLSHAEIVSAAEDAGKSSVLHSESRINTDRLVKALNARRISAIISSDG